MNARTFPSCIGNPVTGELLFAGWQHTDTLQLDLYGSKPTADDGFQVESVTVAGGMVDICELFTGTQLEKMGEWLDYQHQMGDLPQRIAASAKRAATQGPWERSSSAY